MRPHVRWVCQAGFVSLAFFLLVATPSYGVVVYSTDSTATRNTSAPGTAADGLAAWNLEGNWGSFLGTPVGSHYFITANHIGGDKTMLFNYGGANYAIDSSFGSGAGYVTHGDLRLWKTTGTFNDYAPLYSGTDELNQAITIIGRGGTPGSAISVTSGPYQGSKGWQTFHSSDGVQSWGRNVVSDTPTMTIGSTTGSTLAFSFDPIGTGKAGIANEGILSYGDSSGGVFIDLGDGRWDLAGINWGVEDGPFNTTDSGSGFNAAIFDASGLYLSDGHGGWELDTAAESVNGYASRISSNLGWIEGYVSDVNAVTVVPEPATMSLMAVGGLMLLFRRRRG